MKKFKMYLEKVINFNKVIKYLTLSDLLILSGIGLVSPFFAVYITDNIPGGSLETVGIAETLFLLTKSLSQIPIAKIIDKRKGEKDDFWVLFASTTLFSCVFFVYPYIQSPMQLYILQLLFGLASGAALPAWYAIFTRHIDKGHAGIEWGIYRTVSDLGGAIAAALGGYLAFRYGFHYLFFTVAIISLLGSVMLLPINSRMKKKYVLFG